MRIDLDRILKCTLHHQYIRPRARKPVPRRSTACAAPRHMLCARHEVNCNDKTDEKGTIQWLMSARWPYMLAQSWVDNKVTSCLSTIHHAVWKPVLRGNRESSTRLESVMKPVAVIDYTWWMGGVDLHDQKRSYHEIKLQVKKWTTHVFIWSIDAAVTNAHAVWTAKQEPGRQISGREFRLRLAYQLVHLNEDGRSTKLPLSPADPQLRNMARRGAASYRQHESVLETQSKLEQSWSFGGVAHHATRRNGLKLRCHRCVALAKLDPKWHVFQAVQICTPLCSAERKDGRGSNNFKDCCDVPLCIERTTANGGRSCFGLWHEEKHRAAQGARSPAAATAVMADIIAE